MVAPFRELFALIILDGDADLPQHLLVHLTDRRSQCPNRGRGIKIENRHEVLMLEILLRIQPTSGHQGVGDADGGGRLELDFDVEIIVLLQERTVNDVAEVLLMLVPILTRQLSGHIGELLGEIVWDTKTNVKARMEAECGACEDKKRIATLAKKLNMDAIHDTVHEMCKDEARHGAGFKGLLDRYFK